MSTGLHAEYDRAAEWVRTQMPLDSDFDASGARSCCAGDAMEQLGVACVALRAAPCLLHLGLCFHRLHHPAVCVTVTRVLGRRIGTNDGHAELGRVLTAVLLRLPTAAALAVFETIIRVVGGMLSAHDLTGDPAMLKRCACDTC